MSLIVVLADGETWTMIDKCRVVEVTDEEVAAMDRGEMDPRDLTGPSMLVTAGVDAVQTLSMM
jgi:hypothetical protein